MVVPVPIKKRKGDALITTKITTNPTGFYVYSRFKQELNILCVNINAGFPLYLKKKQKFLIYLSLFLLM